jgi:hypothetical protein
MAIKIVTNYCLKIYLKFVYKKGVHVRFNYNFSPIRRESAAVWSSRLSGLLWRLSGQCVRRPPV